MLAGCQHFLPLQRLPSSIFGEACERVWGCRTNLRGIEIVLIIGCNDAIPSALIHPTVLVIRLTAGTAMSHTRSHGDLLFGAGFASHSPRERSAVELTNWTQLRSSQKLSSRRYSDAAPETPLSLP